jgi:hypothetical protein
LIAARLLRAVGEHLPDSIERKGPNQRGVVARRSDRERRGSRQAELIAISTQSNFASLKLPLVTGRNGSRHIDSDRGVTGATRPIAVVQDLRIPALELPFGYKPTVG